MEITYDRDCFVICHNGSDTIHPSEILKGTVLRSGQPFYEEFEERGEWKLRLFRLGYDISKLEQPNPPKTHKTQKSKKLS